MPGVYISYPFCSQKCTYCNFASGVFPAGLEREYLDALEREIRAHAWDWTPETVYLGGGTPGRIGPADLRRLLDAIPGRPWAEAAIEAAPGSVTKELAAEWRANGITRVSLGVQSFVEAELKRTGRRHTAAVVAREVELLRGAGITEINIDLIAGLPFQTAASWNASLDWIARLAPPHVSVYMLEVDDDSRLGREMRLGGVRYGAAETPSEGQVAGFYETAAERLAGMGIPRYEISNFAVPGHESRHNLKYWRLEPYVGFGADAHSFDGAARWGNVESPAEYAARIGRGESPVAETAPSGGAHERFYVTLRLAEGVRPTPDEWLRFGAPIARFLENGWLESEGGALRLTPQGVLFSNEVFEEFLPA